MIDRRDIIATARQCLGTPWVHQGRLPGVGIDCGGLITHVAQTLGISSEDMQGYGRVSDGTMEPFLDRVAVRLPDPQRFQPGDILLMRFGRQDHLAIATELGLIHTYQSVGRVVEHGWNAKWLDRIRAAYSFPQAAPWVLDGGV